MCIRDRYEWVETEWVIIRQISFSENVTSVYVTPLYRLKELSERYRLCRENKVHVCCWLEPLYYLWLYMFLFIHSLVQHLFVILLYLKSLNLIKFSFPFRNWVCGGGDRSCDCIVVFKRYNNVKSNRCSSILHCWPYDCHIFYYHYKQKRTEWTT